MTGGTPPRQRLGAPPRLALVAFSGDSDLWWVRLLKPGFRHCLLILREQGGWLVYDPMAHMTDLESLRVPAAADLFALLLAQGYVVVPARARPAPRQAAPWAPFTCVEAVKRVLGIHDRWILTPWQLFRHLVYQKKVLDTGNRKE